MKKIFLIFVAAVALSSVAASALFAEEKYRHTEQIGAETVTTDVVVTEVSPLEIKFKVLSYHKKKYDKDFIQQKTITMINNNVILGNGYSMIREARRDPFNHNSEGHKGFGR